MKLIREIDIICPSFSYHFGLDRIEALTYEKDNEGNRKKPCNQYLPLDNHATELLKELEQWIMKNLK